MAPGPQPTATLCSTTRGDKSERELNLRLAGTHHAVRFVVVRAAQGRELVEVVVASRTVVRGGRVVMHLEQERVAAHHALAAVTLHRRSSRVRPVVIAGELILTARRTPAALPTGQRLAVPLAPMLGVRAERQGAVLGVHTATVPRRADRYPDFLP